MSEKVVQARTRSKEERSICRSCESSRENDNPQFKCGSPVDGSSRTELCVTRERQLQK